MPGNKTIPNPEASVKDFLQAVEDPSYRKDGFTLLELRTRPGKHNTGKSCLYIKNLSDVDQDVLEVLIAESYAYTKTKYDS